MTKTMTPPCSPSPSKPLSQFTPAIICIRENRPEEDKFEERSKKENNDPFAVAERSRNGRLCNPTSEKRAKRADTRPETFVKCNECRPHAREKISVVPLDNNGETKQCFSMASPSEIFKSLISSLRGKTPKSSCGSALTTTEEQWKNTLMELTSRLVQATRKRDEATVEGLRLKNSITDLEKKLTMLEIYCDKLKTGIEECNSNGIKINIINNFLRGVSEARSSVRLLSRSLIMNLRHNGSNVYERISVLLEPYDEKVSLSKNPKSMIVHLEALLNQIFYEDFESARFERNSPNPILNPGDRSEKNFKSFKFLQGMTWEEVLSKGTKHFSEQFSRYCDRKMSAIVGMLGWSRAWPEPVLEAFFGASKSVWLVHLLANSVHPGLAIFRVQRATPFDPVYMENICSDRSNHTLQSAQSMVRIMVAPGFYVFDNVVRCRVLSGCCNVHDC